MPAQEVRSGRVANVVLVEADALVVLQDRCADADLSVALANVRRDVRDLESPRFPARDLAAESHECISEEALDEVRLKTSCVRTLHVLADCLNLARVHVVRDQRTLREKGGEMFPVDCAVDRTCQSRSNLRIVAIDDGLHQ